MSQNQNPTPTKTNQTNGLGNIGKVVCIGRNYAAHAKEMGSEVPTSPLLFMKPASCVVTMADGIHHPGFGGALHYETELTIQLAKDLKNASIDDVQDAISGVTLGLDLTLREIQSELKSKSYPWERSKCFDGACVLGDWLDPALFGDFSKVRYQLHINDELRQDGDTLLMMFPIYELLVEVSHAFSLQAGDVIMTGTPSGIGQLNQGDKLSLTLESPETQTVLQAWQPVVH